MRIGCLTFDLHAIYGTFASASCDQTSALIDQPKVEAASSGSNTKVLFQDLRLKMQDYNPAARRSTSPLPVGEVLVDYKRQEWVTGSLIGEGGFGEVYLAFPKGVHFREAQHVIKFVSK